MGIDVWVRRARQSVASAESVAGAATAGPVAERVESSPRDERTGAATVRSVKPAPAAADADGRGEFRAELDCLAAAGVVIVGRWHNPLDRRLANDVVLAIAAVHDPAPTQPAKVQQTSFKWPVTQTGDRSIGAARNAFKAFLRGQAERAHARCVVLFGDAAAALADDHDDAAAARIVRQPQIGALRADPNAKKALWLNVSQNVRG